jgi:hypothetical protein
LIDLLGMPATKVEELIKSGAVGTVKE